MSAGAIPWTAIASWCEYHHDDLDRDAAVQLTNVIHQLDADYLTREASRRAFEHQGR